MITWTHTGNFGIHDRTAGYEFTSKTGRFYTKDVTNYSGTTITRYPSESYYDNWLMGDNKGSRARTWHRM